MIGFVTARRHRAEVERLRRAHADTVDQLGETHRVLARTAAARMLERRADAHDLDADHLDGRTPEKKRAVSRLTANEHRVVADEMRDIARDLDVPR